MLTGKSRSLLHFIETPIAVCDPEGRAVYANPSFESRLGVESGSAAGTPLAQLFEAGGREAMLRACADVCEGRDSRRFPLRIGEAAFHALVSPIVSDGVRVGAILVLSEEITSSEKLLAFHRAVQEPMGELARGLDELLEQTGGRRSERFRATVEDGLRALKRLEKWADELQALALGASAAGAAGAADAAKRFDVTALVRGCAASVARDAAQRGVPIDVLAPARLPQPRGDGARLEAALVHWLRERLARDPAPASLTLGAKVLGNEDATSVLVSITESAGPGGLGAAPGGEPELALLFEAVAALRGDVRSTPLGAAGRTIAIRLDATAG